MNQVIYLYIYSSGKINALFCHYFFMKVPLIFCLNQQLQVLTTKLIYFKSCKLLFTAYMKTMVNTKVWLKQNLNKIIFYLK